MFKRTLALALLLSTSVNAADILEDAANDAASTDWSGLKISIFGGLAHSTAGSNLADFSGNLIPLDVGNGLFPHSIDDDQFRLSGGIGVGYDQQFGNWVGGISVDGSLTSLRAEHRFSQIDPNPNPLFNGVSTNTTYQTDIDWYATAQLRLGYLFNEDTLFYGTGGVAIGDVTNRFSLAILPNGAGQFGPYSSPDWGTSGTETGFVIGAGVERKLTENLSLTFNVEYVDLADVNIKATDPPVFGAEEINYRFKNTFTTAKIGLKLSF